ncbi:NAD(P)H-dependent glycerol-3-phosphate dehydrogenase [Bacillus marasmi]|uniref:NAD(P)H-dependent glycerol-3-phosphate dehydrogenase n=1 Tax=Bacillus marasmi TaxID=1926279 RepID=UPI0011CCA695|nr:NAD(P)H-dependent glycerol-3-phosphate dehydrogenase [Bacillus marasmi]
MNRIAVIGAGSWGTALAMVLADNGHEVRLWGHSPLTINEINNNNSNKNYLPSIKLPKSIKGFTSLQQAIDGVNSILIVVPTKAIREILIKLKEIIKTPVTIIHASKGIEPKTFKRVSEIINEILPNDVLKDIVVLSGPTHAEEVALKYPTTITAASNNKFASEFTQNLFMNSYFRVYNNNDILGVELGGALKNIIALGAGICDGLGYGDNAKAALVTRGLSEITRLGCEMGANPLTLLGLAGAGDLIVTCNSKHSRNWQAGYQIGKGSNIEDVQNNIGMVVEGIRSTEAAYHLAKQLGVDMPITNQIFEIVFCSKNPRDAVDFLMNREGKREIAYQ